MSQQLVLAPQIQLKEYNNFFCKWLYESDSIPNDLVEEIKITSHSLLLIPVYFYRVEYDGFCSAALGFSSYGNNHYQNSWVPHNQPVFGQYQILGIAIDFEKKSSFDYLQNSFLDSFPNINNLIPLEYPLSSYGVFFEAPQIPSDNLWVLKFKEIVESVVSQDASSKLPSKHVNNFNINLRFNKIKADRIYWPMWFTSFTYKENDYVYSLDATENYSHFGTKPEDNTAKQKIETTYTITRTTKLILLVLFVICCFYFSSLTYPKTILVFIASLVFTMQVIEGKLIDDIEIKTKILRDTSFNNFLNKINNL